MDNFKQYVKPICAPGTQFYHEDFSIYDQQTDTLHDSGYTPVEEPSPDWEIELAQAYIRAQVMGDVLLEGED